MSFLSLPPEIRSLIYRRAAQLWVQDKLDKHLIERPAVQRNKWEHFVELRPSQNNRIILRHSDICGDIVFSLDLSYIKVNLLASKILAVCFSCTSKTYYLDATNVFSIETNQIVAAASGILSE